MRCRRWKHALILQVLFALSFSVALADENCFPPPTNPTPALFPARLDGGTGFVDDTGRVVISGRYRWAVPFSDGVAWAMEKGKPKAVLVDTAGKVLFTGPSTDFGVPKYDHSSHNLVLVEHRTVETVNNMQLPRTRFGFKDHAGRWKIAPDFDNAESFHEGLAAVAIASPVDFTVEAAGFIRPDGRFHIEPKYERVMSFSEGLAAFRLNAKWGVIDKEGKVVIQPVYQTVDHYLAPIGYFSNGLATLILDRSTHTFIDRNGTLLGTSKFSYARKFSNGLAAVRVGGTGGVSRFPPYDFIGGKWGYINVKGEPVIPPTFDWACPFHEERAAVNIGGMSSRDDIFSGGKWGYVAPSGAFIIEPQFLEAGSFVNGIAEVKLSNRKTAYIDRTGKAIWTER